VRKSLAAAIVAIHIPRHNERIDTPISRTGAPDWTIRRIIVPGAVRGKNDSTLADREFGERLNG